jgi:Na+/phosphate symporter
MVAMGTSLSDRAWGRETAVYRVNGVITVIGGWFFTAFSAFTAAFIFAASIYYGGIYAILGLIGLALFFAYRTNIYHRLKTKEEKQEEAGDLMNIADSDTIFKLSEHAVISAFTKMEALYQSILATFLADDRKKLFKQEKKMKELSREVKMIRKRFHATLLAFESEESDSGYYFLTLHHCLKELSGSVNKLYTQIFDYMINRHHPVSAEENASLSEIKSMMETYLKQCLEIIASRRFADIPKLDELREKLIYLINRIKRKQIGWMKNNESGTRMSMLLLDVLQETCNVVDQSRNLVALQNDFMQIAETGEEGAISPRK